MRATAYFGSHAHDGREPDCTHSSLTLMHIDSVRIPLILIMLLALSSPAAYAQQLDLSFLLTAAERTGFDETTRYDEVMAFVDVAAVQHEDMHLTHFGYSFEGRKLPLVIFGRTADASPEAVKRSGKLRIFIQANIHAGEVAGKEALLMLIRSLASGSHAAWADSVVLLMAPIYNADGNERVNLFNRPRQNGPFGGMGQRPNAQGLDLNRDHMKARSAEAKSLIGLMNAYDPHLVIDLHTTNGTRHGYHLTYSPALNPNTDVAIDSLSRKLLLPAVTNAVKERSGWDTYYYGNLPYRRGEPGWYTFDHRPRFNNNYVGLRDRVAILSEAYSYASFEERILASLYFVEAIADYAAENSHHIEQVINEAESRSLSGLVQGLRFIATPSDNKSSILMGTVDERINPYSGASYLERTDSTYSTMLTEYGAFSATETSTIPEYYVVEKPAAAVVSGMLTHHGITFETLETDAEIAVSSFRVDSTRASERIFQQVQERTVWGSWDSGESTFAEGSLRVATSDNQARLLFYLLEPRSDDGLVNWALLDEWVSEDRVYPIHRIEASPSKKATSEASPSKKPPGGSD